MGRQLTWYANSDSIPIANDFFPRRPSDQPWAMMNEVATVNNMATEASMISEKARNDYNDGACHLKNQIKLFGHS